MLSLDDVDSREWQSYETACLQQQKAFKAHMESGTKRPFSKRDEALLPLSVLARICVPLKVSQKKLMEAATWLWLHPMSSAQQIADTHKMSASDVHRLVTQCEARMDVRADGSIGYCVSDEYSLNDKIDNLLDQRAAAALENGGESSLEQLIVFTFGRKGSLVRNLTIMECIGRIVSRQGPNGLLYSLNPSYDSSAPTHAKMTEEQKEHRERVKKQNAKAKKRAVK